jgi:hypothetical protein
MANFFNMQQTTNYIQQDTLYIHQHKDIFPHPYMYLAIWKILLSFPKHFLEAKGKKRKIKNTSLNAKGGKEKSVYFGSHFSQIR